MSKTLLYQRGTSDEQLTDKMRAFVREWFVDRNVTQAVIRAGYGGLNAAVTGSKLMKNPKIRHAIGKRERELQEKSEVTLDRMIVALARDSFRDAGDLCDPETGMINVDNIAALPEHIRCAIEGIKVKQHYGKDEDGNQVVVGQTCELKLTSILGSRELLSKLLGWLSDRHSHEHSGAVGIMGMTVNDLHKLWDGLHAPQVIDVPSSSPVVQ